MRPELHDIRREKVLKAAREVFMANGYSRTRVEDVAKVARVANATVYAYFENKIGLFTAMCGQALKPFEGLFDDIEHREGDAPTVLKAYARVYFDFMADLEVRALYRTVSAAQPEFPEAGEAFYHSAHRLLGGVLRRILLRLEAGGELSVPKVAEASRIFEGMLEHPTLTISMLQGNDAPTLHEAEPYCDEVVRVFLSAYGR